MGIGAVERLSMCSRSGRNEMGPGRPTSWAPNARVVLAAAANEFGDTVAVPLDLDNFESCQAYQAEVTYDPASLQFVDLATRGYAGEQMDSCSAKAFPDSGTINVGAVVDDDLVNVMPPDTHRTGRLRFAGLPPVGDRAKLVLHLYRGNGAAPGVTLAWDGRADAGEPASLPHPHVGAPFIRDPGRFRDRAGRGGKGSRMGGGFGSLRRPHPADRGEDTASPGAAGFSLHAAQFVQAHDREALARLCR